MKKLRIFHGPFDICGQAISLANSQRDIGYVSDCIVYSQDVYGYSQKAHLNLNINSCGRVLRKILKLFLFLFCLTRYDVFHFYFGHSLLNRNLDMPILRLFGKKIVMNYCGSDVRLTFVEKSRNLYWDKFQFGIDKESFDKSKVNKMKWHNIWVHKVIAPRNLYENVSQIFPVEKIEKSIYVQNQVDLRKCGPIVLSSNDVPVIVHAPTNKDLKGTKYVEKALNELKSDGYEFEYIFFNETTHSEVQKILREKADIVVDQLLLGGFGSLAVEAMSYGKPVIGYVLQEIIDEHCPDLPIYNTNIDNIKSNIVKLLEDEKLRIDLGKKGRDFVEKYCDKNDICNKIIKVYESLY